MSTYMATIAYANEYNNTQYHVVKDIIANSMSGAFTLAMDDFFDEHDACEIRKVVVELQHTWRATGDIYYGS